MKGKRVDLDYISGNIEESEIDLVKENGMQIITLGKRILRTETAGLTTLSIIMFELEQD